MVVFLLACLATSFVQDPSPTQDSVDTSVVEPDTQSTSQIDDELRRAKNEYAYGNYEEAVRQLRGLLYPIRLRSDAQVLEARRYLALSYYLIGKQELLEEEFQKMLFLDPEYELDPFSIAPPVIELFETVRKRMEHQLDAVRRRNSDRILKQAPREGTVRVVDRQVTERSEVATFLPFGVGQFQNGDTQLGVFFAVSEALLVAVNVAAFLYARYGIGTGFRPDEENTVRALAFAQYGSLVMFGTVYSIGVFQARLNFVPAVEAPPVIHDEPLDTFGAFDSLAPGVILGFDF